MWNAVTYSWIGCLRRMFSFGLRIWQLCIWIPNWWHPDHNGGVPSFLLQSFMLNCRESPLDAVTLIPYNSQYVNISETKEVFWPYWVDIIWLCHCLYHSVHTHRSDLKSKSQYIIYLILI